FGGAYTAGWASWAVIVNGLLFTPFTCTTTWTFPGATLAGTSALICAGLTYSGAAGGPLNVPVAPPSAAGRSCMPSRFRVCGGPARFEPPIVTHKPGAIPAVYTHT